MICETSRRAQVRMGKHAVFVVGPAGSGKSTFCWILQRHFQVLGRSVHVINLDPAAESFQYSVSIGTLVQNRSHSNRHPGSHRSGIRDGRNGLRS